MLIYAKPVWVCVTSSFNKYHHATQTLFQSIGPNVQQIINCSLASGVVPVYFKQVVDAPVIKKANLDASFFSNYRPILKLPFISKILEKNVLLQLQTYWNEYSIIQMFQSGFKAFHCTESPLVNFLKTF